MEAAQHIEEHIPESCPECDRDFFPAALEQHLVEEHHWIPCSFCPRATVNEDDLREHLSDHKLKGCSECTEKLPSDQQKRHMTKSHGWRLCPFCDEPTREADILEHLREFHEQCSKCQFRGNLASHLEGHHAGTRCTVCQKMLPRADLQHHMDVDHPGAHCPLCSWNGLLSELPKHVRKHAATGQAANGQPTSGQAPRRYTNYSITRQPRTLDLQKCDGCRKAKVKVSNLAYLQYQIYIYTNTPSVNLWTLRRDANDVRVMG